MIFNRNLHVAVLVAAMMALGARASLVTSNEVVDAVSAWASANGETFTGGKRAGTAVAAAPTYDDDGTTVLYWTVTMSNGGAVIASPDTDLDLVIAVLEKYDGAFPAGHPLPLILKADLRNRLSLIAGRGALPKDSSGVYTAGAPARPRTGETSVLPEDATTNSQPSTGAIPDEVKSSMAAANAQWAKYKARKPTGGMRLQAAALEGGDSSAFVRRIVDGFEDGGRFTHWNQDEGIYDYHTPKNEVCGCVATAGAAILQFFNCTTDIGTIKSLVDEGCTLYGAQYDCSTLGGELDWTILPEAYGGESTEELSEEGRDLLGRATYNMGVLVGMDWAEDGPGSESGAQIKDLVGAFKAYGFKTSRYVEYSGSETTNGKEFMKTLYAQLWCGAPVVLGIRREGGGHAVVACGYARDTDGDDFCRVFMGWGGEGDAWYKFPNIRSYNMVVGAVTMIGYADDAVVPVVGWTDITEEGALTIPGYTIEDAPAAVTVNEQGYFGIRVPISLPQKDQYIWYEAREKKFVFMPFDNSVLGKDDAARSDLDKAIPDEMLILNLNTDVRASAAIARAVALRDNKALLMVSGTSGTERWQALYDSLSELDLTTDMSNKFVIVITAPTSADLDGVDGDPSIGVFDPAIGEAGLRWWSENGRLAYTNFILSADTQTGAIQYEEPEAIAAAIPALLEDGYRAYLQNRSDAVVTVTGVDVESGSDAPFEVAVPIPAYGVSSNAWTNCESVVFSAPGTFTNETEGVIYSCVGWTTNEVFSGTDGAPVYTAGNQVELSFAPGDSVTFTWVWQKTHFRVTAKAGSLPVPLLVGSSQYVSPTNVWCAANDRVTIVAEAAVGDYRLWQWEAEGKIGDYFGFYDGSATNDAMRVENGTSLSFTVYEPVMVTANYKLNVREKESPVTYTVTVTSEPAEVAEFASLSGSLNWGENTVYDSIIHLAPAVGPHVDATGGVWVCTGWIVEGESMPEESLDLELLGYSLNVVSVWELQEPEPEEPAPEPGAISIKSLEQAADGSWTVTVEGAVKDCWYWLYETDDLADFAGDEATWTEAVGLADTEEDNPQQATADGDIVFHVTAGDDAQLFWRARATSTEDDD